MKFYRNCVREIIKTTGIIINNSEYYITWTGLLGNIFHKQCNETRNILAIFLLSTNNTKFLQEQTLTSISPGGDLKMKSKLYSNTNRQNLGAILKAEPEMETYFK